MNIVIIDDHPLVCQGIIAIISNEEDMQLVGEASNEDEAVNLIINTQPDIALVDLRLVDASGLDIVKACKEKISTSKYIILTSSGNREDFRRACEIGVDGYVLKEAFPEELLSAIRLVHRGRKYYDPGMVDFMINKGENDTLMEQLTPRELEVFRALGEGLNNKEIAKRLFITEYTVKKHVSQVLSKLGFSDRTQAALSAMQKRITV
ncbi:response regulator [Desulfosporosinus sp. SYSU MS00001]|uniref:response regulator n=1 Tax=Desulfosporosinus sp. SYSU MS00001 TaxID=3416284 RepID=UPI003CF0A6A8